MKEAKKIILLKMRRVSLDYLSCCEIWSKNYCHHQRDIIWWSNVSAAFFFNFNANKINKSSTLSKFLCRVTQEILWKELFLAHLVEIHPSLLDEKTRWMEEGKFDKEMGLLKKEDAKEEKKEFTNHALLLFFDIIVVTFCCSISRNKRRWSE